MIRSLFLLLLVTTHLVASPVPDFPFTAINGSAMKEVSPDKATITFTVLCYDPSSEVAVTTINKILTTVVEGIVGLGINKEAIVAADLAKEAVRDKGEDFKQLKIVGYDVSREVKVTITEIAHYTAVVRLIMASDNVTRVSTEFDLINRSEVESALMTNACANAKKKAELLCEGAGVKLGDVFAISDQSFTVLTERFGFGYSGSLMGAGDPFGSAKGVGNEVPVFVPAKIEVHASVNLLYRLKEKLNASF